MRTPDFFIVGAPKCGTTAMYRWLEAHPQIFVPVKEIHYFGGDLDHRRPEVSPDRYASLYEPATSAHHAVGDVAVWHLMSEQAADEIYAFNPEARIVIMLRRPYEMLYSLHSQLLYSGEEDLKDFGEALAAESARSEGRRIPASTHMGLEAPPTECLFYSKVASFADQVARYQERFSQVHVVLHDDIKADSAATYRGVLEFLGVDTGFQPNFSVMNPNTQVKSQAARKLIQGARFGPVRGLVPQRIRTIGRKVFDGLQAMNTEAVARPALDPDLKLRLQIQFQEDVERLARLIDRDLSAWST
ncbi:MAG: sulfotransferase [Deltaproteobacteria bacterium]|nr:sulfotransferase [Deltaproteobacteria bacterium]